MSTAIKVENLSKIYRLGEIGTGTITRDIDRWFKTKVMGKEDPFLKIGENNDRAKKGNGDIVYSLQDINFEINQGDAVGIIGRNGAGKSTLLKILSRVTTPTAGKINIKGRVASLLEVGTGFHPELTGRENIYLNGAILGMRKREIDRKLDEIIDFSGVERYIDTPVKRYSSGMYVRLAFAVAAHLESEILIVDEVLAVGDAEFQKKCLGKMGEVSKGEGRTVLFVSHNMAAVQSLCKSVLHIDQGRILAHGNTNECVDLFLHGLKGNIISDSKNYNVVCDEFELLNIELSQGDTVNSNFKYNAGIYLKLNYKIKSRLIGFRIGFDLLNNANGLVLFRTYQDDQDTVLNYVEVGTYESIVEIPGSFLMEGDYTLCFIASIHNRKWLSKDYVQLRFEIHHTGGTNQIYADSRPGVLMPKLNWESRFI
jgi:lipopolysaccharide transport system ATP-binding protein